MEKIQTSLNIGYWNINKLISKQTDKSKNDFFTGSINKSDIIRLAEVKCDPNKVQFDNFVAHHVERKSKKGNQIYGGLGILVKKTIRKSVKYLPVTCQSINGLNLTKRFWLR